MSEFYKYFKENMDSLGLPAPESLYGSYQAAIATAFEIAGVIKKIGAAATMAEIIGAATRLEKLAVVGALGACYYAGAVVGSIAVATGRTLSGGTSIADVFALTTRHGVAIPGLYAHLQRNPCIYNGRGDVAYRGRAVEAGRFMSSAKVIV